MMPMHSLERLQEPTAVDWHWQLRKDEDGSVCYYNPTTYERRTKLPREARH